MYTLIRVYNDGFGEIYFKVSFYDEEPSPDLITLLVTGHESVKIDDYNALDYTSLNMKADEFLLIGPEGKPLSVSLHVSVT